MTMTLTGRSGNWKLMPYLPATTFALALTSALILTTVLAQAQTLTVLHNFTGGQDGAGPIAVTINAGGVLYGAATYGGPGNNRCDEGCGTVFKLKQVNSVWLLSTLYAFTGYDDGAQPGQVVIGPNGSLYGTTLGGRYGDGTVYNMRPPPTACGSVSCSWTSTVLHQFAGGSDGYVPAAGALIFDPSGNIYGATTAGGGPCNGVGCGTVYKLTASGGGWTESILHGFSGSDGDNPSYYGGVILDGAGNVYGTTTRGGSLNYGTAYQLTPSGPDWVENVLYSFPNNNDSGRYPYAGLIFDQLGNVYGTTNEGGENHGGTVFALTPSGGGWTFSSLYRLSGSNGGSGPDGSLVMGRDGSLYGATPSGGFYNAGVIFKLTPSGGGWTYTSLYEFTGRGDGAGPNGNLVFDANGNLYGTAVSGGTHNQGVVFELTP